MKTKPLRVHFGVSLLLPPPRATQGFGFTGGFKERGSTIPSLVYTTPLNLFEETQPLFFPQGVQLGSIEAKVQH